MNLPLFFLSDFGLKDSYVGVMKAIALNIGATGPMIDLTHNIPPQDVLAGAVAIEDALPYLPEQCVVCAVVDPGVGTTRRAIAVRSGGRYFTAPDNGLLDPVFAKGDYTLKAIAPGDPIAPSRSATFHGRDVFAPAAALLASGNRSWDDIGPVAHFPKRLDIPPVRSVGSNRLELTVIAVDHFGNLATNLHKREVPKEIDLHVGKFMLGHRELGRLRTTFDDVPAGGAIVYFNSSARLAVGLSMGNAAKFFGVGRGSQITFIPGSGA